MQIFDAIISLPLAVHCAVACLFWGGTVLRVIKNSTQESKKLSCVCCNEAQTRVEMGLITQNMLL